MDAISIFLIPFAIIFGIFTSYADYKNGVIKNKWVMAALAYSFFVFAGTVRYIYYSGADSYES